MNQWLYRCLYWLRRTPWDGGETPPEVRELFSAGDLPPGPVLDLGCGTGTNVIYMAQQGRQVVGIDFVPAAIDQARLKAQRAGVADRTRFYVADVTRLSTLDLPRCAVALDMGCFHGLSPDGQQRYAAALAELLVPGGRFLLYTLDPRRQAGVTFGLRPEQVQTVFAPWFDVPRLERGAFGQRQSTWFWMVRQGSGGSAGPQPAR